MWVCAMIKNKKSSGWTEELFHLRAFKDKNDDGMKAFC